uniref:ATP synthase subunit a n=1 Tax=Cyamus erraticus TaxID=335539 RepID=Q4FBL8_CYAER|nr:ATPase 6 [Cyamus erraticus]
MMTNLFSIFDPTTSTAFAMNWLAAFSFVFVLPLSYWVTTQRYHLLLNKLCSYITTEFKVVVTKTPEIVLMVLALFIFIFVNNLTGLLPFTFTVTAHMAVTVSMALPLWVALIIYGWSHNTSNLLVHLVPNGTPAILMPLMVVIETISNLIRPLTLAVRLAANMIAGHLLISLLTGATPLAPLSAMPLLGSAQLALEGLEIAVAIIQAYVFSVLITLYVSETTS